MLLVAIVLGTFIGCGNNDKEVLKSFANEFDIDDYDIDIERYDTLNNTNLYEYIATLINNSDYTISCVKVTYNYSNKSNKLIIAETLEPGQTSNVSKACLGYNLEFSKIEFLVKANEHFYRVEYIPGDDFIREMLFVAGEEVSQ